MTLIDAVTLEVTDPAAADAFYTAAFDLGAVFAVRLRRADGRVSGSRWRWGSLSPPRWTR